MNTRARRNLVPVSACFAAIALAGGAVTHAGCNFTAPTTPHTGARLLPVRYETASPGEWVLVSSDSEDDSIVGLWKFEMLSKSTSTNTNPMPDGSLIDFGTVAWHKDHTELMNSGSRNPADGDFCQGVWRSVGSNKYHLNHLAIAWTGGTYTGPVSIQENVTVAPKGSSYTGNFTLVQYVATMTPGHELDETTVAVTITGQITATRITAD